MTARKAHQWTMVFLIAIGFLAGERWGWIPVAIAGTIMLAGRFVWQADVVRQFVWRVAEPRGWLRRRDRVEDHDTRRIARVIGGVAWLVAAALLLVHLAVPAWALAFLIAIMVVLDAALDFCALCFILAQFGQRGVPTRP